MIIELASKGLSLWNFSVSTEHQIMPKGCSSYDWNFSVVGLVIDSFLQSVINSCLTGHTTQGLNMWNHPMYVVQPNFLKNSKTESFDVSVESRSAILSCLVAEFLAGWYKLPHNSFLTGRFSVIHVFLHCSVCPVQFQWEIAWFLVGSPCGCALFAFLEDLISGLVFPFCQTTLQVLADALKWYPAGIFFTISTISQTT